MLKKCVIRDSVLSTGRLQFVIQLFTLMTNTTQAPGALLSITCPIFLKQKVIMSEYHEGSWAVDVGYGHCFGVWR